MIDCPVQNTPFGLIQRRPRKTQKFGNDFKINGKWVYKSMGLKGHNGTDIGIPIGTSIFAPFDGEVVVKYGTKGYGNHIRIRNRSKGLECVLAHLSEIIVKHGTYVRNHDLIALSGNTGFSTAPHLHFGVRRLEYNDKLKLWDLKIANYNNGYFGYLPFDEFTVNWKGTMEKNTL